MKEYSLPRWNLIFLESKDLTGTVVEKCNVFVCFLDLPAVFFHHKEILHALNLCNEHFVVHSAFEKLFQIFKFH